ncbi:MAG TPA: hypothetical protein VFN26_09525 [Candidatus Acidoferrum sp.]|nr:hypothetical protein [Candidatus Acidoferrum sp.]
MLAPSVYQALPVRPQDKTFVWDGSPTATEAKEKKNSSVLVLRGQTFLTGELPEAHEVQQYPSFAAASVAGVTLTVPENDAVVLSLWNPFRVVAVADLSGFVNVQTNYRQRGEPQVTNLLRISNPTTTMAIKEGVSMAASAIAVKPVTPVTGAPDWFGQMTARILRFPKLQSGWDSYGGQTISQIAATRALGIASRLGMTMALRGVSPNRAFVSPTHSGGVLFEVQNGSRELLLEINPDKAEFEVSQITSLESGDEDINEVNISESHLPEVLNWIAGKS